MMSNEINIPHILAEVVEAFNRYEKALVNNDVAVLDELFHDRPETLRYGVSENLYGYKQIKNFRKYRPSAGLQRRLQQTIVTSYGEKMATANTEFIREKQPRIGRQSQTWVKFEEGWRIVAAHVSLMD